MECYSIPCLIENIICQVIPIVTLRTWFIIRISKTPSMSIWFIVCWFLVIPLQKKIGLNNFWSMWENMRLKILVMNVHVNFVNLSLRDLWDYLYRRVRFACLRLEDAIHVSEVAQRLGFCLVHDLWVGQLWSQWEPLTAG